MPIMHQALKVTLGINDEKILSLCKRQVNTYEMVAMMMYPGHDDIKGQLCLLRVVNGD